MEASDVSVNDVIGYAIGVIGIVIAVIFYFRSRERAIPSYVVLKSLLISPARRHLPEKVTIQYDGHPISTLSTATIFFWNRGRKTLDGNDIVTSRPIKILFMEKDKEVPALEIRSITATRDELNVSAEISEGSIRIGFDFLDRGDGFGLEVLYEGGANTKITCPGTIKGVPEGVKRRARTAGTSDKIVTGIFSLESTRGIARVTVSAIIVALVILIVGLATDNVPAVGLGALFTGIIFYAGAPPILFYYQNENIPRSLRSKMRAQDEERKNFRTQIINFLRRERGVHDNTSEDVNNS